MMAASSDKSHDTTPETEPVTVVARPPLPAEQVNWDDWQPMAKDSAVMLHQPWKGVTLVMQIMRRYPQHGLHFIRRTDLVPADVPMLRVTCSCGETFDL